MNKEGQPPGRTDDVIFTWVNKFIVIGCTFRQMMFYSVYSLVCCTIVALIWFVMEVFPLFGVIEYEIGGGVYLVEITSCK